MFWVLGRGLLLNGYSSASLYLMRSCSCSLLTAAFVGIAAALHRVCIVPEQKNLQKNTKNKVQLLQSPSPLGTFSLGLAVPTASPTVVSSDCCDHTVADYGTSLPSSVRRSLHGASHHAPLSPLLRN